MKTSIVNTANRWLLVVMALFISTITYAQDNSGGGASLNVTKSESTTSSDWYTSPWVWVIGAAVFILLFAAIVRGNSNRTDA